MQETFNYLKSLKVNFVATRMGDSVSCRPFGDPVWFDDKIYMLTHAHKEVAKQLANDNRVCIVAYDPNKENWMRIFCEAVDDSENVPAKQAIINEFDWAEESGYTLDNPDFKCYYLANAKIEVRDSEGELLANYTF